MSSGGSQKQAPTTTTTGGLGPEQRALFQYALPGIQQFAARVPERYQGETVAGFTPAQTAGQEALVNAAYGAGGAGSEALTGAIGTAAGVPASLRDVANLQESPFGQSFWDPNYNQALGSAIEAAQRPIYQQLTEKVLPGIRGGAIETGGLGGSRQGVAEGLATRGAFQAAGDVGARLAADTYNANLQAALNRYNQNRQLESARYGTNIDAALKSAALIPSLTQPLAQASILGPMAQTAVGEQQQALNQAILTGKINAWNYDQLAPWLQSKELLSVMQGFPGTQTTVGSVPPNAPTWQSAMGGALSGAALGSSFGPWGTAIGGLGGAALPFLFR